MARRLRPVALNYARRQQYRRLSRAGKVALGSVDAALLGLVVASEEAVAFAGLLFLEAVGLRFHARYWLALARRSRVGARSEDDVQRALAPPRAEGWRLRHSLPWGGVGDIDSVAIAPMGVAVAIETKTRAYDVRHLARVRDQAAWLRGGGDVGRAAAHWPCCACCECGVWSVLSAMPRGLDRPAAPRTAGCGSDASRDPFRRPWPLGYGLLRRVKQAISGADAIPRRTPEERVAPTYANIRSIPDRRYTITEYDPRRPWMRVGEIRHMTVELREDENFTDWAAQGQRTVTVPVAQ